MPTDLLKKITKLIFKNVNFPVKTKRIDLGFRTICSLNYAMCPRQGGSLQGSLER